MKLEVGSAKPRSRNLGKIMNSPGLGHGSVSFTAGTLHLSFQNPGMVPVEMYGRRDSRVTLALAAIDAL
jgi:hypothetical protein